MRRPLAAFAFLGLLALVTPRIHAQDTSGADDDAVFAAETNLDAAIAQATQTIDDDPGNDNAYIRRGRLYFAKAEYEFAIRDFSHVLQDDGTNAVALFQRARSYFRNDDLDAAIADYNQFLQMRPRSVLAFVNRGVAYIRKQDYDQAIDDETQALQISPDTVLAFTNRGWAYRLKGDYDHAIADLSQAIQLAPNRVPSYISRGVAYELKGRHAEARADFNAAIRLNPDAAFAYDYLALQMATCPDAQFRDGKTAVADATKACELEHWNYPGTIATLAAAYAEAGDFDSAVNWQTKFLTYHIREDAANKGQERLKLYENHQPYHRDEQATALDEDGQQ